MDHSEKANAQDGGTAGIGRGVSIVEKAEAHGKYLVQCFDKDGNLKWEDTIENVVCTGGKNDALDKYLAGSAYTAAWYLGLISATGYTTGPAAGDTMASHGGWQEDQNYSAGTRPAPTFAAASGGSKSTSSAVSYSINATTTIKGCFLTSNNTKGGTTGILYSAGTFSNGDKSVGNGDTLNVTYTASL